MKRGTVILGCVVLILLAGMAYGQTDIGFKGVGAKVGYISASSNVGGAIAFGAVVDLGTIMDNKIGLVADVTYWGKTYGETEFYSYKSSSITIAALGKYWFKPEGEQLRPYAGAGLGLSLVSWSWEYSGWWYGDEGHKESASDTDLAIIVVGGADYALSDAITGFAEFRYTLAGNWDFWGAFVGFVYALGK